METDCFTSYKTQCKPNVMPPRRGRSPHASPLPLWGRNNTACVLTVHHPCHPPQQQHHECSRGLLPLRPDHLLQKHNIDDEWTHDDYCIKYLKISGECEGDECVVIDIDSPSTTLAILHSKRTTRTAAAFSPSSPVTPPKNTTSMVNEQMMIIASNIWNVYRKRKNVTDGSKHSIKQKEFAEYTKGWNIYTGTQEYI